MNAPNSAPSWESVLDKYYTVMSNFRDFYSLEKGVVKDGLATFVTKDGTNYENLSMNVKTLSVSGLRIWARILKIPRAYKMRRAALETVLEPMLRLIKDGPNAYYRHLDIMYIYHQIKGTIRWH